MLIFSIIYHENEKNDIPNSLEDELKKKSLSVSNYVSQRVRADLGNYVRVGLKSFHLRLLNPDKVWY